MFEIIYTSKRSFPLETTELEVLLAKARLANEAAGVTGVLLYDRGAFLQVIEGDEAAVVATFDRVARDPRHRNLFVLQRGPIEQRRFASWRMGFLTVAGPDSQTLDCFSDFLHGGVLGLPQDRGTVGRILHAFEARSYHGAIR